MNSTKLNHTLFIPAQDKYTLHPFKDCYIQRLFCSSGKMRTPHALTQQRRHLEETLHSFQSTAITTPLGKSRKK